jgi:hypothetical protein
MLNWQRAQLYILPRLCICQETRTHKLEIALSEFICQQETVKVEDSVKFPLPLDCAQWIYFTKVAHEPKKAVQVVKQGSHIIVKIKPSLDQGTVSPIGLFKAPGGPADNYAQSYHNDRRHRADDKLGNLE